MFRAAAEHAADFVESLPERPVALPFDGAALRQPLPEGPTEPRAVVDELAADCADGIVASAGGRYFGFVTGGALPAAAAADMLAAGWDQNAGLAVMSPAAAVVEEVAGGWLKELLGIPAGASFALVTGAQMANVTCLAAARRAVLARAGWDLDRDGLAGAPPLRVLAGEERHVTIDRALRLLGIGSAAIEALPADDEGRLRPESIFLDERPTIVCAQAGNVNTGAFDPLDRIADAGAGRAWLHVDGAFGLWAAASPRLRHLVAGHERADSWTTDGHKWLNVPYDCGIACCAAPEAHRAAMSMRAPYLTASDALRDGSDWTPEASRRARGFAVYAAIRQLGRSGVAGLVDRCCAHARRFADGLAAGGMEILNEVVLNQVLVRADPALVARVQADGTLWAGATTWRGIEAMRISVSGWATTEADVDRSIAAVIRCNAG
ncbi:MAG TPA: pyridoxal-dependent decarboxylase [Gaiellaceae bacterium]|nr:pyridoxal-dependent decarboxylase [Gaiellaceae bacterium]